MGYHDMKKWLSAILAILMAFTACGSFAEPAGAALQGQLSFEDLAVFGAEAAVHGGRVTFVNGACTAGPVTDMDGARQIVNAMTGLMGGNARTRFEPWRILTDAKGNRYYVFQQVYAGTTVPGGAVKVITDADGRMLGLTASVESSLPDTADAEGIKAAEAEEAVLRYLRETDRGQEDLLEGCTERILLPVKRDIDPDSTDETEDAKCRYVWAVYTTNAGEKNAERPYLAHYVAMDGAYLYSLPTVLPGDEAGTAGYDAAYVFENKEPVEYTGKVVLSDGSEREITVSLMRDTDTGKYCLGNLERRIVVADCWEFIYNKGSVVPVESDRNEGWDNTCLLSLYNYCKAWDYYRDIGWNGGDGLGTPMLILKDFCNRDRQPINNAAYAGKYYGWQVFLSSSANDLARCLDVLAHEFTHCVTGSVMTFNAYMNDYGAINEAMSDIQGNLCEQLAGDTADAEWLLGENGGGSAFRSMSDPRAYRQPGYSWDLYYTPKVKEPTEINDRGGVHSNSSLLNNVAYRLCETGGMSLEEARRFWFAVDCAMVPGTDYAQLSEIMPWVLENQGMEQYRNALEAAMDATRLRSDEMPDAFDNDRALTVLTLPEDDRFRDGHWVLAILSVNWEELIGRLGDVLARRGKYAAALDELVSMLGLDPAVLPTEEEVAADPEHAWERFAGEIGRFSGNREDGAAGITRKLKREDLTKIWRKYFGDTFYAGQVAAGQDGRTIRLVCRPGQTIPLLYRLEIDSEEHIQSAAFAIYTFGSWMDIGPLAASVLSDLAEMEPADGEPAEGDEFSWLSEILGDGEEDGSGETGTAGSLLGGLIGNLASGTGKGEDDGSFSLLGFAWSLLKEMLFWRISPAEVNVLPADGLDSVGTMHAEDYPFLKDLFSLPAGDSEQGK